ncbi:DUF2516 family protein [Nocardioides alcanivorans]|uniref:DUF2516 family protein n=1 Tax=Nocardioides alcanivorans TaxID=2897352 RepID=UPI001F18C05B|nr:DUF2516 family protein [Nocardioides alcanivorans]
MSGIIAFQSGVMLIVLIIALVVKTYALVNALLWSAQHYEAAGKLTKPAWVAILGVGFAAQIILIEASPLNIIHLIASVAAIVYIVDVRPAMATLRSR